MSFEEEFDRIIRQRTEEQEHPFDEKNWEKASRMLDARRSRGSASSAYIPAALVLALGTAGFFTFTYIKNHELDIATESTMAVGSSHSDQFVLQEPQATGGTIQTPIVAEQASVSSPAITKNVDFAKAQAGTTESNQPAAESKEKAETPVNNKSKSEIPTASSTDKGNITAEPAVQVQMPVATVSKDNSKESEEEISAPATEMTAFVDYEAAIAAEYLLPRSESIPLSDESDLMPVAFQLPSVYDDYFQNKYKNHWLAAEAGAAFHLGWNIPGSRTGQGMAGYGGLTYGRYLCRKMAVSFGIQMYNTAKIDEPYYRVTNKDYGFGSTSASTVVTITQLFYAAVPVKVHYILNNSNQFALGVNAGLATCGRNRIDTFAVQNDLPVTGNYTTKGVYDGVKDLNLQLTASYRLVLTRRLALNAEYLHGLSNYFDTSIGGNASAQSRNFRLGIQFLIFDK